ncbi:DUF2786 domain-containing protein [Pseudomonas sp.]|jgi:hypothetical protein|uniref:DUF2786 domain-containing protein n=1 Tax=Pseudomonas sp. TaxID=306 RepID=UPI002ED7795E
MSDVPAAERERVLRKIKHCLALSKSSNEHEAAAALRQAQKLMRKYQLTDMDVELADVGKASAEQARYRRPSWDTDLSSIVAAVFGCETFTHSTWMQSGRSKTDKACRAIFVGVTPAQQIAKYAYDALYVKVTQARRDYVASIKRGEAPRGRHTPSTRGNHFAEMWVAAVGEKLHELVPKGEDDDLDMELSTGCNLVAVQLKHNELIGAYLNELTKGEGLKSSRQGRKVEPNLDDLLAGILAGRDAQLSAGIAHGSADLIAIGAP